jgi:hypothetical protein
MKTPRGREPRGVSKIGRKPDYFFLEAVFLAELLAPPDFDPALLEAPFFAAAIEVPLTLCPLR